MSLFEQGGQHVGSQQNAGRDIYNYPPPDKQSQADLRILLGNVERTWLSGVLDNSLYNQVLLSLGKELRVEAIDHPWSMVFENPAQERKSLPPERKIKEIFDEDANRLLLILGEPGSGKTITLLQLARELISELKQERTFTLPIPVIFNLSTWTNKKQALADWLVMELLSKYRVPKKQGRGWLEEQCILPLLDGLDEVKAENRTACVEQINQLKGECALHGLVVCSRFKEYDALEVRLQFNGAIYLQPLTATQISQYIVQAGDQLVGLGQALPQDEVLQSLANSPLMLNIMSLAYQNTPAEQIITPHLDTVEARRPHLFDTYIRRMFQHKGKRYSQHKEEIKKRLAWLAWNMQRHNQEIFLIEGLQPSWLTKRRWRWSYVLASRWISVTIFWVIIGVIGGLTEGLQKGLIGALIIELIQGFFHTFFLGILLGLPIGIVELLRLEWFGQQLEEKSPYSVWFSLTYITIITLILSVSLYLFYCNTYFSDCVITTFLSWGLIFGSIFGLRGSKQNLVSDIQAVKSLIWSRPLKPILYSIPIIISFGILEIFFILIDTSFELNEIELYIFFFRRFINSDLFSNYVIILTLLLSKDQIREVRSLSASI